MSDYIKREDAIKSIKPMVGIWADDGRFYVDYQRVLDIINNEPSADVEPVRHSVWRVASAEPDKEYECMNCKKAVGWKYLYCPNCGARMDGKEQEHE